MMLLLNEKRKGICPQCRRPSALTKSGTIIYHRVGGRRCQGAGWWPTYTLVPTHPGGAVDAVTGKPLTVIWLRTHGPDQCISDMCAIHNPSEHHMGTWPQNWRDDRRILERGCPHGIWHPDPDDIAVRIDSEESVHGCDGCCVAPVAVGEES